MSSPLVSKIKPTKGWVFQPNIFDVKLLGTYGIVKLVRGNKKLGYLLIKTKPLHYKMPFHLYAKLWALPRPKEIEIGADDICTFIYPYWQVSHTGAKEVIWNITEDVVAYKCGDLVYHKDPIIKKKAIIEWIRHREVRNQIETVGKPIDIPSVQVGDELRQGNLRVVKLLQLTDVYSAWVPVVRKFFNHIVPNVVSRGLIFFPPPRITLPRNFIRRMHPLRRALIIEIYKEITITSTDHAPLKLTEPGTYVVWHQYGD